MPRCITLLLLVMMVGCASVPVPSTMVDRIYRHTGSDSLLARYAPIIAPQQTALEYNRIGRAAARFDDGGRQEIYINSDQPVFYTQEQRFTAVSGQRYLNLIYRFHFTEVPQPHLTAGKNGGLFVIVTLNEQEQPLLITTVHSCGCYLAMVPTRYLDRAAYPEGWDLDQQSVYGETLPGRLDYPALFDTELRPLITLRSATHRVMGVGFATLDSYRDEGVELLLQPMAALDQLPLADGHTSFFNQSGYVKGAFKPWELLLMSWWSLDLNVGRDKRLADPAESGVVFYTSLKPWARNASNMWFFADFLDYWGWRL